MPPLPRGNPTQVVELVESPSKNQSNRFLKLHSQVLHSIGCSAGNHPLAVIVIAGPARGGKSFILTYLVRYLQALEKSKTGDAGDWMEKDDPSKSMKDQGFEFRNGTDRATDGIWMWSRPFLIKRAESKEPIAVIVADTEGCFDPCSTEREQSAMVGLGLLASSCFIFNESSKINENTLLTLAKFMQYGQVASQSFQGKGFQRLMFLVRDWSMPNSYEYGAAGGQNFLKKAMERTANMTAESVRSREDVLKYFQDTDAYLMPHPGEKVLSNAFTGSVGEMSPNFQFHVEKFIEHLVEDVSPKVVGGAVVRGNEFVKLFQNYVDAFNHDDLPSPASILKAMTFVAFETERKKQVGRYSDELGAQISKRGAPFLEVEALEKLHQKALLKMKEKLTLPSEMGTEEERKAFQERLSQDIQACHSTFLEQNESKQKEYISGCEGEALQGFEEFISENFASSQKYWSAEEFAEIMITGQAKAQEDFLKATKSCSKNLRGKLLHSFLEKVSDMKTKLWQRLEAERKSGEIQMEEIIEDIVADYAENLSLLASDQVMVDKILVKMNDKYLNVAIKTFEKNVNSKFADENFVQEYRKNLELQLQQKFEEVSTGNSAKLEELLSKMDKDILEAVNLLREELEEVLPGIKSCDYSALDVAYQEVFEVSAELLEDLKVLDRKMYCNYLDTLRTSLEAVLSEVKETLTLQHVERKEQFENAVAQSLQKYSNKLQSIFEEPDEFFNENELQSRLRTIQDSIQHELEESLGEAYPDQRNHFLQCFAQSADQEREEALKQNVERRARFEAFSAETEQTLKAEYLERIKSEEESCKTDSELAAAHESLSSELIQRLKASIPAKPGSVLIQPLEKSLKHEFDETFKNIESSFGEKLVERATLSGTTIPNILNFFESQGVSYINANPLISLDNLDTELEELAQDLTKQVQQHIDAAYPTHNKEGKQIMRRFLNRLEDLRMDVHNYRKTYQRKALTIQQELVKECIQFADMELKKAISSATLQNQSNLQEEFDDIRGLTEGKFQSLWSFGENDELKQSTWKDVIEQVQLLEKVARSKVVTKVAEEERTLVTFSDSIIHNLTTKLEDQLSDMKIISTGQLESSLKEINDAAPEAFSKFVAEKKPLNPEDVMNQLKAKLVAKLEDLQRIYDENTEAVRTEAIRMSKSHLNQQKRFVKSQSQLENLSRDAENKGRCYLVEKCGDETLHPELFQKLLESTEACESQILQELCSGQNESLMMENAVRTYREYMKKHVDGKKNMPREKLTSHHKSAVDACMDGCLKHSFLSNELETKIERRLLSTLQVYDQRLALEENQSKNMAIGIDLGTTTCCVAIYQKKGATVIKSSDGHSLTPSYIYFPSDGTTPTVGKAAKDQAHIYPESTVFDSKRLIGREFRDPHVQNDIKIWPFEVKPNSSGRPEIIVNNERYSPEDISARLLRHMKDIATRELGPGVKKAVITVPANFDDRQRDATRQAARIAGLEVMNIINEPTAAAMAYAVNWKDEDKNVLVFDFGGGTLDVTILRACGADLTVLTTMGDTHLGGEDIDGNMMEFCAKKFEEKHGIQLMKVNPSKAAQREENVKRRLRRLRGSCEDTKQNLTAAKKATIHVQAVYEQMDLQVEITRVEFDQMNEELFKKSIKIVQEALRKTKLGKEDINEVLMVGGSSRIPRIQEMLKDFLGHRKLVVNQDVDIQEAVALGASIQACILNGGASALNIILKDVQPFSLGISVEVDNRTEMSVIIPKDSNIPVEKRKSYTTKENNQEEVRIEIFSGEDLLPGNNKFLGSFVLTGIPRGPRGSQGIDVLMQIDANGILNVTAVCVSNGTSKTKTLEIQENRGRLSDREVERKRVELESASSSIKDRMLGAFGMK